MDNYHITKEDDLWKLTRQGGQRASLTAKTKAEAIEKTRAFMESRSGSVKIHKQNGQIQEERTYPRSKDPRSSRG